MRAFETGNDLDATSGDGKSAAEKQPRRLSTVAPTVDGKSAVDDADWFSVATLKMHPHKPGTVLHLVTGLGDERLCQRYAADHVRPPAYFLRRLLRGRHGRQWLNATMDGCTEQWWLDHQRADRIVAQIDALDLK